MHPAQLPAPRARAAVLATLYTHAHPHPVISFSPLLVSSVPPVHSCCPTCCTSPCSCSRRLSPCPCHCGFDCAPGFLLALPACHDKMGMCDMAGGGLGATTPAQGLRGVPSPRGLFPVPGQELQEDCARKGQPCESADWAFISPALLPYPQPHPHPHPHPSPPPPRTHTSRLFTWCRGCLLVLRLASSLFVHAFKYDVDAYGCLGLSAVSTGCAITRR